MDGKVPSKVHQCGGAGAVNKKGSTKNGTASDNGGAATMNSLKVNQGHGSTGAVNTWADRTKDNTGNTIRSTNKRTKADHSNNATANIRNSLGATPTEQDEAHGGAVILAGLG